jgi:hypothetical protein
MSTRQPELARQPADDPTDLPNEAAGVLARADDPADIDRITFVDTNRQAVLEAWISADVDTIEPVGGVRR